METPAPLSVENISSKNNEKFKSESNYNINSNKNNCFNIFIRNLTSCIEINASYQNYIKKDEFKEKFSLSNLKENKYLSICESIDEIYEELKFNFSKNNSIILENENQITINVPVNHSKYKELTFTLNKKIKTDKELYQDLFLIVSDLKNQIKDMEKEKNENNKKYNKEIDDLKNIIKTMEEKNKNSEEKINLLENKVNLLEKEISNLKNDKVIIREENQINKEKNQNINVLENKDLMNFEEIENPWTNEKEKGVKTFDYILKDNNCFAERKGRLIYYIKSKHKFEKNKIYKLKYNISIIKEDFRVGFGDYGECSERLKESGSIGLTDKGLYIDGKQFNDIKIKKENKEIIFIINLKEDPYNFEIFIDGKCFGKFLFYLDTIYGLAAIYEGSIKISTLRSLD